MSDPSDIVSLVGGGLGGVAGVGVISKYIWESVKGRKDQLEDKAEKDRDAKLDAVLSKLNMLELDFRSLMERYTTQTGQVTEAKARIEGISTNYGNRLGTLESSYIELRTRLVALEADRDRPEPRRRR